MSRPVGEIRQALRVAAVAAGAAQGSATWTELATSARVGLDVGHATVLNMARHGELVRVGHEKRAGGGWIGLYEPAPALVDVVVAACGAQAVESGEGGQQWAPLAFVLGSWPREG